MGQPQRKKRSHNRITTNKKSYRLRKLGKFVDQIYDELKDEKKVKELTNQPIDADLPGLGQYYCLHCAKYFISETTLKEHTKTKVHRRRLKELKDKPYSIEEAEAAGGLAPADNGIVSAKRALMESSSNNINTNMVTEN